MYTASKEHHSLGSLTSVHESYETPLYVNGKTQQRPWGSSVFLPRGQSVEKMKLNIKYWLCIFEEQGWRTNETTRLQSVWPEFESRTRV